MSFKNIIDGSERQQYVPFNRLTDINFKQTFNGIPKSIMKFHKDSKLMELIGNDDSDLGKIDGYAKARGGGYAKNLRYSIYNPTQAKFILEYYTDPGFTVLDPFAGRGTRSVITSYLGRNYIGYDTSLKTIRLNEKLIKKLNPNTDWKLVHGDGTTLEGIEPNSIDSVFTCPPYYDIEVYSGEIGDLSHLKHDEFDLRIEHMFERLYNVIKFSDYENKIYHNVIITVGTIRMGKHGILDMDYVFQNAAKKAGFVLYDKMFTENNTPGAGFTFRRNYKNSFLTKSHETTLIFAKFK